MRVACWPFLVLTVVACATPGAEPSVSDTDAGAAVVFEPWRPGFLDIHHISVEGDAAFFVFPDSTTMLFDAGEDRAELFNARAAPLLAAERRPDAEHSAGYWMSEYIRAVMPAGRERIDYAVISHFHSDHYGQVTPETPVSETGRYKLTGMVEIAERIGIETLIDRGYPDYDFPVPLRPVGENNPTLANYFDYVAFRDAHGERTEQLAAGRADQITLKTDPGAYPGFEVRAVKANNLGWTGEGEATFALFSAEESVNARGGFSENPMSLALKVSYGDFDYFTAGDMLGPEEPDYADWLDSETPLAPVVGEVDVFALNHHGVRDANNAAFVAALQPQAHVIQGRTSDHPGQEVFYRLMSEELYPGRRDLFSTYIHDVTLATYGPWFAEALKSGHGHIVVRVAPGGASFEVFILDDSHPGVRPLARFGPYRSRSSAH